MCGKFLNIKEEEKMKNKEKIRVCCHLICSPNLETLGFRSPTAMEKEEDELDLLFLENIINIFNFFSLKIDNFLFFFFHLFASGIYIYDVDFNMFWVEIHLN